MEDDSQALRQQIGGMMDDNLTDEQRDQRGAISFSFRNIKFVTGGMNVFQEIQQLLKQHCFKFTFGAEF